MRITLSTLRAALATAKSKVLGRSYRDQEVISKPENDNQAPSGGKGLKPRRAGSKLAIYPLGESGRVGNFHLCPVEAAAHGLQAGDRVVVERVGQNFIIRHADKGATIVSTKTSLLLRVSIPGAEIHSAESINLSLAEDGGVLVRRGAMKTGEAQAFPLSFLHDFKSLNGYAGQMRRAFLAANDNEQQEKATTSAGDQCYTPIFFVRAILRAAMREMFDIDCCSMRSDGRYDLDLDPAIIKGATWPSPVNPEKLLQVVGAVPAKRHMTKDDTEMGSLLLPWDGDFIWLNPPYSRRAWAVFLEKAAREVAADRAGIVVALVPMDTYGPHIRHMFDENAYRIELSERLPFFMKRKERKDGSIEENIVETIRGNTLVVIGKGTKTKDFLGRLVDELLSLGYLTEEQAHHYRQVHAVWPNLQVAA